jgi:hypothetical protein
MEGPPDVTNRMEDMEDVIMIDEDEDDAEVSITAAGAYFRKRQSAFSMQSKGADLCFCFMIVYPR